MIYAVIFLTLFSVFAGGMWYRTAIEFSELDAQLNFERSRASDIIAKLWAEKTQANALLDFYNNEDAMVAKLKELEDALDEARAQLDASEAGVWEIQDAYEQDALTAQETIEHLTNARDHYALKLSEAEREVIALRKLIDAETRLCSSRGDRLIQKQAEIDVLRTIIAEQNPELLAPVQTDTIDHPQLFDPNG